MYQIIYIDIDEEITSVIDKLRKIKTAEVFLAIPKRALILQSIMSLKLLFREAERSQKHMIVVTQDPQEQKTVEKAGIETRSSLEGLDTEGEMRESVVPKIQEEGASAKNMKAQKEIQRKSMEEIGSNDFYDIAAENKIRERRELLREDAVQKEGPRRMMTEISREKTMGRTAGGMKKEIPPTDQPRQAEASRQEISGTQHFGGIKEKEELLGSFFETNAYESPKAVESKASPKKQIPVSGKLKKAIFFLLLCGLLVAGGALAYLFLPQAEVRVSVKSQNIEKDLNLRGDSKVREVDASGSIIPVRLVEKEMVYTSSFPVTGKSAAAGKKAKGMVVIYNEFSSTPQSLVATTRLESTDKKIFRLTKGVTVPGTNEVDGKVVPGAIEAEVIADEGGEEYNIDPTTFSIPGFSGSPKFTKFSAKSSAKMMGGSALSQGGGVMSLTQTDIAMAKGKAEAEAKSKIKDDLRGELRGGEFFSESVTEEIISESAALSKVGDIIAEFQYKVKIKERALVFLDADVKKILLGSFNIADSEDNQERVTLDYGAVSGDFTSGTITVKVHGMFNSKAQLEMAKLKADLAGKSGSEIEELIKSYPQIAEIEINVTPAFLFKKVPQITRRINIVVN